MLGFKLLPKSYSFEINEIHFSWGYYRWLFESGFQNVIILLNDQGGTTVLYHVLRRREFSRGRKRAAFSWSETLPPLRCIRRRSWLSNDNDGDGEGDDRDVSSWSKTLSPLSYWDWFSSGWWWKLILRRTSILWWSEVHCHYDTQSFHPGRFCALC